MCVCVCVCVERGRGEELWPLYLEVSLLCVQEERERGTNCDHCIWRFDCCECIGQVRRNVDGIFSTWAGVCGQFVGLTGVREGENDDQYMYSICMERGRPKTCGKFF